MPDRGHQPAPPRIAQWLLRRCLPTDHAECLIGDLVEEYRDVRLPRNGLLRARTWYWGQAIRTIGDELRCRGSAWRSSADDAVAPPPSTAPSRTGDGLMSNLVQDVRYGVRTLLQTPTFTVLTILTLALAIGVTTAIFSMVNLLMFRPLPIKDGADIAFFYFDNSERGTSNGRMSEADFLDYRDRMGSFTELAAVDRGTTFVMTGHEEPVQIIGFEATANNFDVWKLDMVLGRGFRPGEDAVGAQRVAVLSHGTWERRFGSDPEVIGRTIRLNDHETTIVGVVEPAIEFGSLADAELWIPLYLDRGNASPDNRRLWVSGRLRPGVTHAQAQQEAVAVNRALTEERPEANSGWQVRVEDLNGALAPDQTWTIFYMLVLTVVFVLLIACSNIATMMLSRASSRSKEVAVRAALGAGRWRILRQLLTESLLLSVAAGGLGLAITSGCLATLVWMVGDNAGTNFFHLLEIDRNVLGFTLGVALIAPLLFGFLPALRASRADLNEALKDSSRGSSGGGGIVGRRVLVAVQVSLALALMVVAGLLTRFMIEQRTHDLGYDIDNVLTMRIELSPGAYPESHHWRAFFDDARTRVEGLPEVELASWMAARPLADGGDGGTFIIEGQPLPEAEDLPFALTNTVDEHALDLLRLPILRGRGFAATDDAEAVAVALINEDMVQRYWNGDNPVGDRIRFGGLGSTEPWHTVVGVVGNMFSGDIQEPSFPMAWVPLRQNPQHSLGLLVRTASIPGAVTPAIRREIWEIDADQPLGDVRTLRQVAGDNFATADALVGLFLFFAGFALIMASTGIYGVLSFVVAQRTQEIGIRMALGAQRGTVMGMVGRQALWLVVVGLVVGAAGALALGRIIAGALPGVSPGDPWTLAVVSASLLAAAVIAVWVPARRAVRIDPIVALRQE